MSKAKLEFNLPEERDEFHLAANAGKYYCTLHDVKNKIRSYWKYREFDSPETHKVIDELYEEVCLLIGDILDEVS